MEDFSDFLLGLGGSFVNLTAEFHRNSVYLVIFFNHFPKKEMIFKNTNIYKEIS